MADLRFWKNEYRLDKMTLGELAVAYFIYPAIPVYLLIGVGSAGFAVSWASTVLTPVLAAVSIVLLYPLAWYLIHRFVLHSRYLYKLPFAARTWKRIHFDHHRDPNDLSVLFGALHTTLPTIAVISLPVGWAIGGPAGAAAALSAGVFTTCVYEFCHCVQHLNYVPRQAWLRRVKTLHLAHHFHDETRNFGITSFLPDRLLGTYAASAAGRKRSSTVFNLGYTGQEVARYPWVARLTPDLDEATAIEEGVGLRHPGRR